MTTTPMTPSLAPALALRDLKAALGNASKPDITHVRIALANYTARSCEYGNDKYERANFRRPTGGKAHIEPTREDFERFRAYVRAAVSHLNETLDAMELHQAGDPRLEDVAGMKRAAYAVDTDVTPGAKVGASLLPHIAPACASMNMALTQATDCGLLPRDPGTPWRAATVDLEVPGSRDTRIEIARSLAGAEALRGRCVGVYDNGDPEEHRACARLAGCCLPGCPARRDTVPAPAHPPDAICEHDRPCGPKPGGGCS